MTFSRKIFISVFLSTLILGSVLIWATYLYVNQQTEEKFVSRYSVFTKILAATLNQLDLSTEALMLNAAKVVEAKDAEIGLLSDSKLRSMRDDLKMTHLFVTDKHGKFIRSTNEDAAVTPNLFSFCQDYKKLISGHSAVEATPVIKPQPEPKPFKFLSIPSRDRNRIIEVGVRVDFIAKTLAEATASDSNVVSMSLYAPDGTSFGKFDAVKMEFKDEKVQLPNILNAVLEDKDAYRFYSKVISSHPRCCQCDLAGTSRNGEYYYVLESKVSKRELTAIQATTGKTFFLLGLGNLLLSFILSRFLSRRLVRNVEQAAQKVRQIGTHGDLKARINLPGHDEVAFLTGEFDRLLDKLEISQGKLVEAEKVQAKVQMAKEIAHNIRSPIVAIEMMLPSLITLPERILNTLRNSVREIKGLSEKLSKQAAATPLADGLDAVDTSVVFLPTLIGDLVDQKNLEYSDRAEIKILFSKSGRGDGEFVKVEPLELKAILSNLVNNAVESYSTAGVVSVDSTVKGDFCVISVSDSGVGIPEEFVGEIGKRRITFKGDSERGLGLVHACKVVETWGGKLCVKSELGRGTTIEVVLPRINKAKTPSNYRELMEYNNEME